MTNALDKLLLAKGAGLRCGPQIDYGPITDAIGVATGFVGDAGSVKVISSTGASSPWWAGQVVEVSPHDDVFGGGGVLISCPDNPFQISGAPPMTLPSDATLGSTPGEPVAPVSKENARCFSVSFGKGVVGTVRNIGLGLPLAAHSCVAIGPALQPDIIPALDEPAAAVRVVGRMVALDPEPQQWVDTDDEPTWLLMDDLPYHGGGVMSRRRHDS